jgi:hypothetical protein
MQRCAKGSGEGEREAGREGVRGGVAETCEGEREARREARAKGNAKAGAKDGAKLKTRPAVQSGEKLKRSRKRRLSARARQNLVEASDEGGAKLVGHSKLLWTMMVPERQPTLVHTPPRFILPTLSARIRWYGATCLGYNYAGVNKSHLI